MYPENWTKTDSSRAIATLVLTTMGMQQGIMGDDLVFRIPLNRHLTPGMANRWINLGDNGSESRG
jgi:hypothetical protein